MDEMKAFNENNSKQYDNIENKTGYDERVNVSEYEKNEVSREHERNEVLHEHERSGISHKYERRELVPVFEISMDKVQERIKQLQQFIKSYMIKGEDYGVIPGTPKPTLLKPGAEKLCDVYGFSKQFDITNRVEDWENGFFHYEVKATLINKRTGLLEAEGVGSCNSKEKRYQDRWVIEKKLLPGTDKEKLQKREREGRYGKYYEYLSKNEDPYTLVNTILKMAKKRALVDAVLSATRSSGIFTQDIEDMADGMSVEEANTEDIRAEGTDDERLVQSQSQEQAQTADNRKVIPQIKGDPYKKATEAQAKMLYAIAREAGMTNEEYKNFCADLHKKGEITSDASRDWLNTDVQIIKSRIEQYNASKRTDRSFSTNVDRQNLQ